MFRNQHGFEKMKSRAKIEIIFRLTNYLIYFYFYKSADLLYLYIVTNIK